MAKSKSKTTGTPAPTKRVADTRRYRSRAERDAYYNRIALISAAVVAGVLIVIVGAALLVDNVIVPNQAVASAGGQNISTRDFQRRVTFERWRTGTTLAAFVSQFGDYAQQFLSDPQTPYGQAYSQLSSPLTMGSTVLNDMVDAVVIQQYANANGIKVDEADINKRINEFFGYEPDPKTATPTLTPTITTTALVSPTPTTTPTVTPVPSQTATPTLTPYPTGIPTATPGPTQQKETFDKNRTDYLERAARATGFSEAEIRQIFSEQALREKVQSVVVPEVGDKQDQIKSRHILVQTEQQAKDVMAALQQGESFANLAKAVSQDTSSGAQGGELGWKSKGAYVPEFEEAIWSDKVKVGDVLGPIKTQYGYHIIQVEGREMRTLTEAEKTQLEDKQFSDWLTKQRTEKNVQLFDLWRDRVPTSPTLEELGLPSNLGTTGGFPGNFPIQ
jgi:peptidyl-prolyl cis-trans isomerase D